MQIEIREAKEEDLPRILPLYKELDESGLPINTAKEIFQSMKGSLEYCKLYVAVLDKKVVGTFVLFFLPTMAHGKPSAVVEDVAVSRECQGQGIGKAMMNYAMKICKEKNCYKIALSSKFKRENAHKFYEALGFEKLGYSFSIAVG